MAKENFFQSKEAFELLETLKQRIKFWEEQSKQRALVENAYYPLGFVGKKKSISRLKYSAKEIEKELKYCKSRNFLLTTCIEAAKEGRNEAYVEYGLADECVEAHYSKEGLIYCKTIDIYDLFIFCQEFELSLQFENCGSYKPICLKF